MRILVVDDEQDIVDLICINLKREGHEVVAAYTGEDALKLVKEKLPDLMILDLLLPGIQGLDVCRQLRSTPGTADIPILILSAKAAETDRILGFEMGADDYLTKPFSVAELISRVRVALRRSGKNQKQSGTSGTFSKKGLFIDFEKYEVMVKGKKIALPPTQRKLLFFFAKNPGRVYSRDQLLDQVWGSEVFVTPRNIDVHISRLRRHIEQDAQRPDFIVTVTSVGYKFNVSDS
jgi:DNA-binding response OmpR family regulator